MSGDAARKLFDNLKKRFLKKRLKYRKLKAGNMPPELVNAAKDEMDSYAFLNWLVPHIRMRRTKRDLNVMELSGMMEVKRGDFYGSDEACSESYDEQETFDEDPEMENASMVSSSANYLKTQSGTPIIMQQPPPHPSQKPSTPSPTDPTAPYLHQPPLTNGTTTTNGDLKRKSHSILSIKTEPASYKKKCYGNGTYASPPTAHTRTSHGNRKEGDVILDDIDLFGRMIAAEIKQLPARDQCIAKHQIHTVLFELKMSHFSQSSSQWQQSQQPVYVVSNGGSIHPNHRPAHESSRGRTQGGYRVDSYYPADSSLKESND